MRNDSETNIAVHISEDKLHVLQQKLREAEVKYGLQSGEAGNVLMEMVDYLQTISGSEETIKRLNERIDDIVQYYLDACEE